ncbi:MAG: MmgE/PrpD family protein [Alphaproteobacteria bacterium]|nr:MmgE/PrpD family protein [Alphaproteobacteria bacterium]
MGVTEQLARMVVETPGDALGTDVIESARLRFLDTIGIALAGSREPATLAALATVRHMGGTPAASIPGQPDRTSSPLAGFVTGVAAHSQEYDDYTKGVTHASVAMVPGSLALAEDLDLSGRAMIEGFALGFELESRVAHGLRPALLDRGWHPNGIVGALGVAAAGARFMGLDLLQTRMAIGIAASEGQGLRKNVGSMGKAFHVGHGVRNGVFAALLAREGYAVDPDIIESSASEVGGHERFGLAECFSGPGNYSLERMVEALGERWELARGTTNVCFHPGSTAPATTIDAVIDLAIEYDIDPDSVDEVVLYSTPQMLAIACYDDAPNSYRARYCLPWSVAVSLIDRKAGLAQYAQARIDRGDVQPLMERVSVVVPDDLAHHAGQWGVDGVNWAEMRLTVRLKDGTELRTARSHAKGSSEDPATWDDVAAKFEECAEGIIAPTQRDEAIAMIAELESLPRVGDLTRVLRPSG